MKYKIILACILMPLILASCQTHKYSSDSEIARYFQDSSIKSSRIYIKIEDRDVDFRIVAIDDFYINPESDYSKRKSLFIPYGEHSLKIEYKHNISEKKESDSSFHTSIETSEYKRNFNNNSYQIKIWLDENELESSLE